MANGKRGGRKNKNRPRKRGKSKPDPTRPKMTAEFKTWLQGRIRKLEDGKLFLTPYIVKQYMDFTQCKNQDRAKHKLNLIFGTAK